MFAMFQQAVSSAAIHNQRKSRNIYNDNISLPFCLVFIVCPFHCSLSSPEAEANLCMAVLTPELLESRFTVMPLVGGGGGGAATSQGQMAENCHFDSPGLRGGGGGRRLEVLIAVWEAGRCFLIWGIACSCTQGDHPTANSNIGGGGVPESIVLD
jgi:hypothetical protein